MTRLTGVEPASVNPLHQAPGGAGDGHKSIGSKQHIVGDARGTSAGDLRQECQ